ncbi:MAG: GNAT family N-acetyltransferase [Planctomycetota bacterium]
MSGAADYHALRPSEVGAAAAILSRAFGGGDASASERWIRNETGLEHVRVLCEDGAPLATAVCVPMDAWMGGRTVSHVGIAGVAVAPEARGRGLARRIMTHVLKELQAEGVAISALYSAMHRLYRGVGYQDAGELWDVRVPAGMIEATDRGGDWRPMRDGDLPAIAACARARGRLVNGAMERGPYCWRRVFTPRQGDSEVFVAEDGDGGIEAYAAYRVERRGDLGPQTGTSAGMLMVCTDVGYASARGLQRLLGFLRGFASVVGEIELHDFPGSPFIMALLDRRYWIELRDMWMLRLVDVPGALAERGYPAGLDATIRFRVSDDLLPQNDGGIALRIRDGVGEVTKDGTSDAIDIGVREFAPLYTGMLTASQLAHAGHLRGSESQIALADAAFGGGRAVGFDFF